MIGDRPRQRMLLALSLALFAAPSMAAVERSEEEECLKDEFNAENPESPIEQAYLLRANHPEFPSDRYLYSKPIAEPDHRKYPFNRAAIIRHERKNNTRTALKLKNR